MPYLVDAAQTAGAVPNDVERIGNDLLAFTGHKGLLGPTGTGGLYVREGLDLQPPLLGGTGRLSDREVQPEFLPDRYESGTLNVAGLAGLAAGVRYVLEAGVDNVRAHETPLVPLGSFMAGTLADVYGSPWAVMVGGILSASLILLVGLRFKVFREGRG